MKTVYEAVINLNLLMRRNSEKVSKYFSIRLANRLENILSANIDDVPASVLSLITDEAGSLKDEEALLVNCLLGPISEAIKITQD